MSEIEEKFKLPTRFLKSTRIWTEYENLASEYKPLNLGQGFPDCPPPTFLTDALIQVAKSDNNLLHQYTRDYGHPRLVKVLGELYSTLLNRPLDSYTEILITVGASEALFVAILGHVDVGEEVIIIEPFFDCYVPMVRIAGGVARFAPLQRTADSWTLDQDQLESLFNSKTKMLILNNPHNSFGKVFTEAELRYVARLCVKWNVLCLSDEVYEWMVYKPNHHVRIATLPGMWDRTITVGSGGKVFGVTGWKVGWAYGPSTLLHNLMMVHQNSVYTGITPMQEALAMAFEKVMPTLNREDCYFQTVTQELERKRNFMAEVFAEVGLKPVVSEGGYFMSVDWSALASQIDLSSESDESGDFRCTKWLIKNVGLQGIPMTAFYSEDHRGLGENFIRFCYFKRDETLQEAASILRKLKSSM